MVIMTEVRMVNIINPNIRQKPIGRVRYRPCGMAEEQYNNSITSTSIIQATIILLPKMRIFGADKKILSTEWWPNSIFISSMATMIINSGLVIP